MPPGSGQALCFTISVVDETDLADACVTHVRRAYPDSPVVLVVDSREAHVRRRWRDLAATHPATSVIDAPAALYAVDGGGRVVSVLLEAFLATQADCWLKIDPDTYVRRPLQCVPRERCFFGTLQGGSPMPSLQGGCVGGPREAAEELYGSGVLASTELVDYESSWARDNPILLGRARERGLVSFDFVHAWACQRLDIPLRDHPEIRSHWLGPPSNGRRYAITHPHKDLAEPGADTMDRPSPFAELLRMVVKAATPAGAVVAVVSHGDDELIDLEDREGWHFPRHPRGFHLGEHPADSSHAIALLEQARAQGAGFLVVPEPSIWWLDHYLGLSHHLSTAYSAILGEPEVGVVFDLRGEPPENINTAAYWDSIHREQIENGAADEPDCKRRREALEQAVVAIVPGAARALDLGCGSGLLCRKIKQQRGALAVTGVDFSGYVTERNAERDRALGVEYRRLDVRDQLHALDDSYDVVTLCDVVEMLDRPEQAVADAAALLRPGGRLIVAVPADEGVAPVERVTRCDHAKIFELLAAHGEEVRLRSVRDRESAWIVAYCDTPAPVGDGRALQPPVLAVRGPNRRSVEFIRETKPSTIAEIGVYRGYTSRLIADFLSNDGELHLFDFEDVVAEVAGNLRAAGFTNVVAHGNSRKILDSYNWSLMRLIERRQEPLFDYVYLDGAHTWPLDALAFLLVDRLLKVGGHVDFDDHDWRFVDSPTMNPDVLPAVTDYFTDEQLRLPHVALTIDLLVRRDRRYDEVIENKVFRKSSA